MTKEMVEEDKKRDQKKEIDKSQIETALRARFQHFRDNADSFTLERVRRLIENDLGIEKYALDVHKRFIKKFVEENMDTANEDSVPKDSKESVKKDTRLTTPEVEKSPEEQPEVEKSPEEQPEVEKSPEEQPEVEKSPEEQPEVEKSPEEQPEVEKSPEEHKMKKDVKDSGAEDEKKLDDSPIMGVMEFKSALVGAQDAKASESSIKKAIWERSSHIRANAETMTLASVRRYLEEEMGLEKNTLDPFKKFIRNEVDNVLTSEAPKSKSSIEKKPEKQRKPAKKITKGTSDSRDSESDKMEDRIKSVKKAVPKGKNEKSEGLKKRKSSDTKADVPSKKQKVVKKSSENDAGSDGSESEDIHSQSTAAKSARKKAVSAPGYGEHVENLKSIIKSCGMSVPPNIYKKAKQVPEDEREDFISKELEQILSREGLSSNPSEKEIKEVKKRKERAKELEGIDISNIVSSSRRRSSTTSFVPPPKPKSPVKDDKSDAEDSESDNNDSSDDNDTEEDGDGSQIDEQDEDHGEDSD